MDEKKSSGGAFAARPPASLKVEDILVDPTFGRKSHVKHDDATGSNVRTSNDRCHSSSWTGSTSYGHQTTTAPKVKKEDAGGKATPCKRSPSPLPDLHPRITEKGDYSASIKCLSAKRVKRDHSPDLTYIIADAGTSNAKDGTETLDRQRSTYQAPEEIRQARNGTTLPTEEATEPGMSITSEWLLDPAISSCSGMLVMVRGSSALHGGAAWHGGDYEGAQGIVLSVHNTGADNELFPSTARVKFLKPLHPPLDTFAVPVSLLYPVAPDAAGQQALIVRGQNKGKTAKLWEEVSQGWYVCAAYDYFEVAHEDLVRLLPSAES